MNTNIDKKIKEITDYSGKSCMTNTVGSPIGYLSSVSQK